MKQRNKEYIAIPACLKIENGALSKIGTYLKDSGIKKTVIFFGNGLIELFGTEVMASLSEAGIEVLEYQEFDSIKLEDVTALAFSLPNRQSLGLAAEKSLMRQNIAAFYANCRLSASPLPHQAMGSPARALLFSFRENELPCRPECLTA